MEPHGEALYRDGGGQARGTIQNASSGLTSRTREPIHPRVNPCLRAEALWRASVVLLVLG
jgi:hypothetical protein